MQEESDLIRLQDPLYRCLQPDPIGFRKPAPLTTTSLPQLRKATHLADKTPQPKS